MKKSDQRKNFAADNAMWKGDEASQQSGRDRAERRFALQPCEACGNEKSERHHIDGNTLNNDNSNIKFLCRRHHMIADGRINNLKFGRLRPQGGDANPSAKLTWEDINDVRGLIGSTSNQAIGFLYGVSEATIRRIGNGESWKEPTNQRSLDLEIISTWKSLKRRGHPPPYVQGAYDRESVRRLLEE